MAVCGLSYKSALAAMVDHNVQAAKNSVLSAKTQSDTALENIKSNLEKSGTVESRLSAIEQQYLPYKIVEVKRFHHIQTGERHITVINPNEIPTLAKLGYMDDGANFYGLQKK